MLLSAFWRLEFGGGKVFGKFLRHLFGLILVFIAVMVHVAVLLAMTPCNLVDVYRRIELECKGSASLGGVGIAAPSDHDTVSRPTARIVEGGLSHRYLNA